MVERTVHVYAKCLTLGEHLLYDLSQRLGFDSWLGHPDGGEAIFTEGVAMVDGRPVRFRLQIGGCGVPGSFELKDEGRQSILVEHDDARILYGPVPPMDRFPEFLVAMMRVKEARETLRDWAATAPLYAYPLPV